MPPPPPLLPEREGLPPGPTEEEEEAPSEEDDFPGRAAEEEPPLGAGRVKAPPSRPLSSGVMLEEGGGDAFDTFIRYFARWSKREAVDGKEGDSGGAAGRA